MAAQDFQRGAQMAMQAAGIADQAMQRQYLNQLHQSQVQQMLRKQEEETGLASTVSKATESLIPQYSTPGGPQMLSPQPDFFNNLALKLAGQPGGIAPGLNMLNAATNMEKAGNVETPSQRFQREQMLAILKGTLAQGNKNPNQLNLIQQSLDPSNPEAQAQAKAILDESNRRQIEVNKAGGLSRAKGFGDIRYLDIFDPETQKVIKISATDYAQWMETGQKPQSLTTVVPEKMPTVPGQTPAQITRVAEAKVPGSQRAASVRTATTVMNREVPEIIRLRQVVKDKNLLPTGGFRALEEVNQWLLSEASDPQTALLKKKVKMLADNLQRTIGGSQGGEWAFKVAADILNPSYDTQAFTAIVMSHTETLNRMADAYKNYGKEVSSKTDLAINELIKRGKQVNDQTITQALKLLGE